MLAALLSDSRTTHATLPAALRAYDTIRVPEAQRVVESSRLNGRMYELNEAWDWDSNSALTPDDSVLKYEIEMRGGREGGNEEDEDEEDEDEEMRRLRRLAAHIMAIHDWEWATAPEPGEGQPDRALRIFEEELVKQKDL